MERKVGRLTRQEPKHYAIILAAGVGNRFEGDLPKQFCEVAGRPLLMHTLDVFYRCLLTVEIILVLHSEYTRLWEELVERHAFDVPHTIVPGGKERFHSTQNALDIIPDDDEALVAIHDGVRPFVSQEVIMRTYEKAREHGAVVPAISTVNPMRLRKGNQLIALDRTFDRSDILVVQTPQVFGYGVLKQAFKQAYQEPFRDDSLVVEHMGKDIHVVEGNRENIKITYPMDLALAEVLYSMMFEQKQVSTG